MGFEKRQFQGDRRRIARVLVSNENGEVEQIDLAVWHRPLTPANQARLEEIREEIQAAGTEDSGAKSVLIAQLSYLLTRWDITEGGEPIAPTADALAEFEFEFLVAIQEAIFEPLYPKLTT